MTLRDDLLGAADELRGIPADLGLRRFSVTLRRRVWSGPRAGDGEPTLEDVTLVPSPRVKSLPSNERQVIDILVSGSYASLELYQIGPITPDYATGGYTAAQLRLRANAEVMNVEPFVILVGDDGFQRECVQVFFKDDRAFSYSMVVQKTNRKAVMISSIAVTPSPARLDQGSGAKLRMRATGTFEDGTSCDVTPLVAWSTEDAATAVVDSIGQVTAVASGHTRVLAQFRGLAADPAPLQVVL